ncbi:HNH endonuclease [Ochrobactrum sp. MC-1LL]|uniref:HNH endonuclease n=1 Tax=Ochrobactrum sp. MC-1LL TaxID=2735351 RepID=UPI001438304C|nr:HNH endonuclease [Ochrobactrum sp. MC-1LL]
MAANSHTPIHEKFKKLPPLEYLRECLDLNIQTGALVWKDRPRRHFVSLCGYRTSQRLSGQRADGSIIDGYRTVLINGTRYAAHRIVWLMATGDDPQVIDHINHDKEDNRPENLRSCADQQNHFNRKKYRNNSSGLKGVHACNGKWRAMIRIDGKSRHIGMYETPEKAHEAYLQEAKRLFGEFACA